MTRWHHHKVLALLAVLAIDMTRVSHAEDVCEIRQTAPRKNSPPLLFCSWYHKSSCCLPAHDADMNEKFLALVEAGPTCEKYHNKAKLFLAMAFCYACAPDQPSHFSEPANDHFFNASKTAKICSSIADRMAPKLFADCGLLLPDDRERSCSPNSAVVPELIWPDCSNGEYVCLDQKQQNWYCSVAPCALGTTPPGFANAPCDTDARTCGGALMFLNDNRAAKPPYFEDYTIEIVDEERCLKKYANATRCKCLRPPIHTNGALVPNTRPSHLNWIVILMGSMLGATIT